MKAILTKEEYKEFTEGVDFLKIKHDIDIPHTVETKGDKFLITLLEDIDEDYLDNLLENTWHWVSIGVWCATWHRATKEL